MGNATPAGPAPYLDAPLPSMHHETVKAVLRQPWMADGVEQLATAWAITHDQPQHLAASTGPVEPMMDKNSR